MTKENRQYLIVGLFVIIGIIVVIGVFLWFSERNRQQYNTYLAIFNEAVDGLNSSSVVKYNGVEIGAVQKIELNSKDLKQVYVYLNIQQQIPINAGTIATLKPQGITGLSYIDLQLPDVANPLQLLKPHNSPPYPIIATKPSLMYNLTQHAQSISQNIQDLTDKLNILLSDTNIKHISGVVSNLDQISSKLSNSVSSIKDLSASISQTSDSANNLLNTINDTTLQNLNSVIMPNLNSTLESLSQSSSELQEFLLTIDHNPSMLIRGRVTPKFGPGEK
jgi:phospholipid/cholesterol/gamma-HCH transport system substrate-binding protein